MKWFTLIKGYAANEFAPDATPDDAELSAAVCATCPTLKCYEEEEVYAQLPPGARAIWKAPPMSGWCGGPPGNKIDGVQCGCVVLAESTSFTLISVKGRPVEPAGKTMKAGFRCPQGKWSNP